VSVAGGQRRTHLRARPVAALLGAFLARVAMVSQSGTFWRPGRTSPRPRLS